MRDLFDEFMEELRRRQAALEKGQGGEESDSEAKGSADRAGEEGTATEGEPSAGLTDQPAGPADASGTEAEEPAGNPGGEPTEPASEEPTEPASEEPIEEPSPIRGPGRRRRGGGRGGPPRRRGPGGPRDGAGFGFGLGPGAALLAFIVGALVVVTLAGVLLDLSTDAIWYHSVGFDGVFWTRIGAQVALFVGALAIALGVLLLNVWLAGRFSPSGGEGQGLQGFIDRLSGAPGIGPRPRALRTDRYDPHGPYDEPPFQRGPFGGFGGRGGPGGIAVADFPELPDLTPLGRWILLAVTVLAALSLAGAVAGSWETILLWQHQVPFAAAAGQPDVDPIFHRNIGFFLFELPFLRLVQSYFNYLVLAALLVSLGRYLIGGMRSGFLFPTSARVHLAVLGGLYLLSVAAGYQLDKFELVYGTNGVATGVAFTDQNARFLALDVMTIIAAFAAAFLVGGAFTRLTWPLGLVVVSWFVASFVLGQIYPGLVQRLSVDPNQLAQEQPYIQNNISMTRLAYGLDRWDDSNAYSGTGTLTQAAIAQDAATFQNARLWDYRPLAQTLDQLQTVRQYYQFDDVDTDRYQIAGTTRQVMLAGRELAPDQLAASGQLSWVNQHITYTHGIGLAMVPVNEVTSEGQPNFFIRDLPPVSATGAPTINQARIYFGEAPSDYVIVGARQAEFDYPSGSDQSTATGKTTAWTGTTGIRLDSTLTRLLFAARFRDLNLLISDQITSASQLLFHRSLQDRLQLIAPFLRYDKDPYLVVTNGRLVYVQDAYTISDRFPNAQPFNGGDLGAVSGLANDTFDYLRNSVKVVMDAYDGTMTFYVADPSDPIVQAYEGVFPSLFKPISAMPADLRAHLRYPEELFNVQARQYATYHVTDVGKFYFKQDLWTVPPNPVQANGQLPLEAYYVIMRMPGQQGPEFLLLQPLVPKGRPNMIAWVAARNDQPDYGQVKVFKFPQDTTILGPQQIEARIDQDPTISAQFTLWGQIGSTVIRGNLIVVPVQDALVYLEPIYLQSTTTKLPEFKKIIVASPSKVVWGDTLAQALSLLLSGTTPTPSPSPGGSPTPGPSPGPTATPGGTPAPGNVQALVDYANHHFELAQEALRAGDFARYGQEIAIVQATLRQLQGLVGTPQPGTSPASSASPAP